MFRSAVIIIPQQPTVRQQNENINQKRLQTYKKNFDWT